jgi:hypothetical protein
MSGALEPDLAEYRVATPGEQLGSWEEEEDTMDLGAVVLKVKCVPRSGHLGRLMRVATPTECRWPSPRAVQLVARQSRTSWIRLFRSIFIRAVALNAPVTVGHGTVP